MVVVLVITSSILIPRGNVRQVECSTLSSGRLDSPPSSTDTLLVDTVYPIGRYVPCFI